MRLIVCGGTNYRFTPSDHARLDALHAERGITSMVSAGGPGAELGGEFWAAMRGIAIRRIPGDEHRARSSCGPWAEADLSEIADAVVVFPGDRTLREFAQTAVAAGLTVHDWRTEADWLAIDNVVADRFLDPSFFRRSPSRWPDQPCRT